MSGKFIVFEGLDGSGTTTQSRLLFNKLARHTPLVHLTAEPSTGPVGQLIRQIIKLWRYCSLPTGWTMWLVRFGHCWSKDTT